MIDRQSVDYVRSVEREAYEKETSLRTAHVSHLQVSISDPKVTLRLYNALASTPCTDAC
jgi:hypothetical protein